MTLAFSLSASVKVLFLSSLANMPNLQSDTSIHFRSPRPFAECRLYRQFDSSRLEKLNIQHVVADTVLICHNTQVYFAPN